VDGHRPEGESVQGHVRSHTGSARLRIAAVAAAVALAAAGAGATRGDTARGGWRAPNFDLAGTRANLRAAIDARNVGRLRVAWRFVFPENTTYSGLDAATPLVLGDRVYVQSLNSNVYALDLATGHVVWRKRYDKLDGGPNGLAAAGGRIFGATDTGVFALDRATGRQLWRVRLTTGSQPIDVAPVAAGGLVVTSTTGMRPGGKGTLYALDGRTGRVRWRFVTIKEPWAVPTEASGGGAWWPGSIGSGGTLYVGVANALPFGGSPAHPNGGAYAGDALYTDSLLALGLRTGRLRWYDQLIPHDVRDYDFAASPVVGRRRGRETVFGAGKNGVVYAWDARTRRRVWSTPVGRHLNDTGPLPTHDIDVCPGLFGGVLTPLALASGRLFVPVVDLCFRGSAYGFPSFGATDPARGRGELVALSATTGRRLWLRRLPSPAFGCATVSRDVVFTATYAGVVYAFDARDGRLLWKAREPAGINACPAVVGDTLLVGAGAEPSTIRTPTPQVTAYRLR
jgi:outer membrane protein assembly factor BamB